VEFMGAYGYIKQAFESGYASRSAAYKRRLFTWRRQNAIERIEKPTNVARARELGYKAKQGVVVVRARVPRGRRKRQRPDLGRKPSKYGMFFSPKKGLQVIAEERVATHYPNCEVLNSYWVGEDGSSKYFEVILVDRSGAALGSELQGMAAQRGRAQRGLTSSGRKARGLLRKGFGAEKLRPSIRAHERQGK
jgi:large subunit ribosomal protein L15e